MLDLGANVDCTAEHLLQFAVMGSAPVSVLKNDSQPTVGLLNIGEEAIKGNEVIKQAGVLLRAAAANGDLNFKGNVEGNDIFKGVVALGGCSACAAWCSRATARPTPSPSSRRWCARMMQPTTSCSTTCGRASPMRRR